VPQQSEWAKRIPDVSRVSVRVHEGDIGAQACAARSGPLSRGSAVHDVVSVRRAAVRIVDIACERRRQRAGLAVTGDVAVRARKARQPFSSFIATSE
jgi:hypothetical protein